MKFSAKIIVTAIGGFFCLSSIQAQSIQQLSLPEKLGASFSIRGFQHNPETNAVEVVGFYYQNALVMAGKEGGGTKFGSGYKMVPAAFIATLEEDGQTTLNLLQLDLRELPLHKMAGKEYTMMDVNKQTIGSSAKDHSLDSLRNIYPALRDDKVVWFDSSYQNMQVINYMKGFEVRSEQKKLRFNPYNTEIRPLDTGNTSTGQMVKPEGAGISNLFVDGLAIAPARDKAYIAIGVADKEDKFRPEKNRRFVTYAATGEILNQMELNWDFPKELIYTGTLVNDANAPAEKQGGAIFVFGRPSFVGKKHRDPDNKRKEVVILNPNGSTFYAGTFMGKAEKRRLGIKDAYRIGDKVYAIAYNFEESAEKFLLTFTEEGLSESKLIPGAELDNLTVGRTDLGIDTGFSEFAQQGQSILQNQQLLSFGYQKKQVDKVEGDISSPEITAYRSFIILHYDNNGQPLKQVIIERPSGDNIEEAYEMKLMAMKDNRAIFCVNKPDGILAHVIEVNLTSGESKFIELGNIKEPKFKVSEKGVVAIGADQLNPQKINVMQYNF